MNSGINIRPEVEIEDGVTILSPNKNEFEDLYLKARTKENRTYSDDEVAQLPFASEKNPHLAEWKLRAKSFLRLKKYLIKKSGDVKVLDVGCGNGWFAGRLSKNVEHNFFCIDVNLSELKQAARVFKNSNINFYYGDIYDKIFPENFYDFVILNSSVQYFKSFNKIISRLLDLLKGTGEIHIIDSPFYSDNELAEAQERTKIYYSFLGTPQMSDFYFHHCYSSLKVFNYQILFDPKKSLSKFFKEDSPFPWIKISK